MNLPFSLIAFLCVIHCATAQQLPTVSCEYETRVVRAGEKLPPDRWTFFRSTSMVTHSRSERLDQWTVFGRQIGFEQWFHKNKIVVEFSPGDLKAKGEETKWEALFQIIDPDLLQKLKESGTRQVAGHKTRRFKGDIAKVRWEIDWIEPLGIPAKILRIEGKDRLETKLKSVNKFNGTPTDNLTTYRRVDYADLGDLERDPQIRNLLQSMSGHTHHSH